MSFKEELTSALNRACAENRSNTPDFILARYLIGCLNAFDVAVNERTAWYDPKLRAGAAHEKLGAPVEGVVAGSNLEQQIQSARREIETWAMGIADETTAHTCQHGYKLADLADGTSICRGCCGHVWVGSADDPENVWCSKCGKAKGDL